MPPRTWHPSEFPVQYGRYLLEKRIAFGGMAEIFLGRFTGAAGFEKAVVVKRLLPHLSTEPMVELLLSEAKVHAAITHRNVVQVYELQQADTGEYYLVLEYVDGTDLGVLMRQAQVKNVRIPIWFSLWVVCEVLSALNHVHAMKGREGASLQIIHRDISPSNVFVSYAGDIKVGDFGVVKSAIQVHLTESGIIKGKLEYAAPEQVTGEPVDHRLDLFAVGVILWELLAQQRLFASDNQWDVMQNIVEGNRNKPSVFRSDVPDDLDDIVLKALAIPREDRYQSAEALLSLLRAEQVKLKPVILPSDVTKVINTLQDLYGDRCPLERLVLRGREAQRDRGQTVAERAALADDLNLLGPLQRGSSPVSVSEFRGWEDETHSSARAFDDEVTVAEREIDDELEDIDDVTTIEVSNEEIWVELSAFSLAELPEDQQAQDELLLPTTRNVSSDTNPVPVLNGPMIDGLELEPAGIFEERVHDDIVAPDNSGPIQASDALLLHIENEAPLALSGIDELHFRLFQRGSLEGIRISIGQGQPIEAAVFAQLTDQEGRWLQPPKETATYMGTFESLSLSATLADLARKELSGLVHMSLPTRAGLPNSQLEIHLSKGQVTKVLSDREPQQLPALLRGRGLVDQASLEAAVFDVVLTRRRLAQIVAEKLDIDASEVRSFAMSERLGPYLNTKGGRYMFVTRPENNEPGEMMGPFLLKAMLRTLDLDSLKQLLEPYWESKLTFSRRFIEHNRAYYLSPPQRAAIHHIASEARICDLSPEPSDELRAQLAMIYNFLQTGQLVVAGANPLGLTEPGPREADSDTGRARERAVTHVDVH